MFASGILKCLENVYILLKGVLALSLDVWIATSISLVADKYKACVWHYLLFYVEHMPRSESVYFPRHILSLVNIIKLLISGMVTSQWGLIWQYGKWAWHLWKWRKSQHYDEINTDHFLMIHITISEVVTNSGLLISWWKNQKISISNHTRLQL